MAWEVLTAAGLSLGAAYVIYHAVRNRVPLLLTVLLAGVLITSTPMSGYLQENILSVLAEISIVVVMFLIGLQIDAGKIRALSKNIFLLVIFNICFSLFIGFFVLSALGFSPLVSAVVPLSLSTVPEAVLAPLFEEIGIMRTPVALLIIGAGVLDDVAEIVLVSLASILVGEVAGELVKGAVALAFFALSALLAKRVTIHEYKESALFLLMFAYAFVSAGIAGWAGLGAPVGGILAGLIFGNVLDKKDKETLAKHMKPVTYGFFAPLFFFHVGTTVDVSAVLSATYVTLALLVADVVGKGLAALAMKRVANLTWEETGLLILSLSAKFSMGLIAIYILFSGGLVDTVLMSSFVALSVITTFVAVAGISILGKKYASRA